MTTSPATDLLDLVPSGDWRGYEAYVAGALAAHFGNIRFDQDVLLPGKLSGTPRQIDVMALALEPTAIECKYVGRKIDVAIVDAFVGKLHDVGLASGIIVTAKGFTAAAERRARADDLGVQLAIIAPGRRSDHQHRGAPFIWRDATGISLGLIDNWLCDVEGSGEPGQALMMMYPLGHSRASAMKAAPVIYANLLSKPDPATTLDAIAAPHQATLATDHPAYRFDYQHRIVADRNSIARTALLRRASGAPPIYGEEHALYVDYGNVVLLLVLCAPPGQSERLSPQLIALYEDSFAMTLDDRSARSDGQIPTPDRSVSDASRH